MTEKKAKELGLDYKVGKFPFTALNSKGQPTGKILLSLMAQYTPDFLPGKGEDGDRYAKIRRKITTYEYTKVADEAVRLGFSGFMQERSSATKRFTPDF